MKALAVIAALAGAGCYGVDEIDATWEPVETVTGVLAPEVGPEPAAVPAPADGVVRVVTWNVQGKGAPQLVHELVTSPALARADAILLQEVRQPDGDAPSRAREIAEALGMTWVYVPAFRESDGTLGNAIVSRFPIRDAQVMRLPLGKTPIQQNPRIAVRADLELDGVRVTIANLHLDVRLGVVDRIRQVHPATTQLPPAALIGGDFNTNPWAWVGTLVPLTSTQAIVDQDQARVFDDYMSALGYRTPIAPDTSTLSGVPFDMRLDTIYARGYEVLAAGVESGARGPDHKPVWIDAPVF